VHSQTSRGAHDAGALYVHDAGADDMASTMARSRSPLFQTVAGAPAKALNCGCGAKEFILLFAVLVWSSALLYIPGHMAKAGARRSDDWLSASDGFAGKPRVITVPEAGGSVNL
jgi:hypothetical protein